MNRARFHGQSEGRRLFLAQALAVFMAVACLSGAHLLKASKKAAKGYNN